MKINTKAKGTKAERDLFHLFWNNGWACVRSAGSGSNRYPSPDLIASNGIRTVAIEVKILANNSKYFPKKEITQLKTFSRMFNAEPWVSVKFNSDPWIFVPIDKLVESDNSFVLTSKTAKEIGKNSDEFLNLV
ncbi:MAG: Holliday junction resolvase [Nitrospiraceae bacterium]|nr:Holliday junction resolvase [Nitrospiraceae bacterium]